MLPGFEPDTKFRMLESLVDDVEIVIAINANHIEKGKTRGDLGIPYDEDVLRLIDVFRSRGFLVGSVVLTNTPISPPPTPTATASSNSASPAACTTRSPDTRTTSNASFQTTDTARTSTSRPPGRSSWSPRPALAPANSPRA